MSSTKKKIVISMVAVLTVVALAAVALVAVFAARQVTVNSGLTITYTAEQVKATVSGSYQRQGDASPTSFGSNLTFDGTERTANSTNAKSFSPVDITLTYEKQYVDLTYTIANTDTTKAIRIALTDPNEANDNVTYTYTVTNNSVAVANPTTENLLGEGGSLAAGESAVVTIRIAIEDAEENVTLTNKQLVFALSIA